MRVFAFSQDLHLVIYSCIESYASICKNQEDFLNELFSTSPIEKTHSSSLASCLLFHHRKASVHESLSIIDYSVRLVIDLIESSSVTSSLLINQILVVFLLYLVNHTDFYHSLLFHFYRTLLFHVFHFILLIILIFIIQLLFHFYRRKIPPILYNVSLMKRLNRKQIQMIVFLFLHI